VDIQAIVEAIRENRIRITDHADEEAHADRLSYEEVFFSVLQGEIIETYPTDKPISELSDLRRYLRRRSCP
jgi:hypothetical protein